MNQLGFFQTNSTLGVNVQQADDFINAERLQSMKVTKFSSYFSSISREKHELQGQWTSHPLIIGSEVFHCVVNQNEYFHFEKAKRFELCFVDGEYVITIEKSKKAIFIKIDLDEVELIIETLDKSSTPILMSYLTYRYSESCSFIPACFTSLFENKACSEDKIFTKNNVRLDLTVKNHLNALISKNSVTPKNEFKLTLNCGDRGEYRLDLKYEYLTGGCTIAIIDGDSVPANIRLLVDCGLDLKVDDTASKSNVVTLPAKTQNLTLIDELKLLTLIDELKLLTLIGNDRVELPNGTKL